MELHPKQNIEKMIIHYNLPLQNYIIPLYILIKMCKRTYPNLVISAVNDHGTEISGRIHTTTR